MLLKHGLELPVSPLLVVQRELLRRALDSELVFPQVMLVLFFGSTKCLGSLLSEFLLVCRFLCSISSSSHLIHRFLIHGETEENFYFTSSCSVLIPASSNPKALLVSLQTSNLCLGSSVLSHLLTQAQNVLLRKCLHQMVWT